MNLTYVLITLVNCIWSDWGNWTSCSSSCGGGNRTSKRKVRQEAMYNGNNCLGNDTRIEACNNHLCPGKQSNLNKHNQNFAIAIFGIK